MRFQFLLIKSLNLSLTPLLFSFQILVLEIKINSVLMVLRFDRVLQGNTRSFGPDGGSAAAGYQGFVVLKFLGLDWS